MTHSQFTEKVTRIFGSLEAYRRSLPTQHWIQTRKGWASHSWERCPEFGCNHADCWTDGEGA